MLENASHFLICFPFVCFRVIPYMCAESIESEVSQQRTSTVWKSEVESEIYLHVFVKKKNGLLGCFGAGRSTVRSLRQNLFGMLRIIRRIFPPLMHT